jgi:surface antigen
MSWDTFKKNILRRADSPEGLKDIDAVANLWASEYDNAIKRGKDTLHQISIQTGNVPLLKQGFKSALMAGGFTNLSTFSLVNLFGPAVISYWAGAVMKSFPIPIIPAPGSIQNLIVNSNSVVTPGIWTPQPPISPTNSTGIIVDQFIMAATIHLNTISGIINTISMYPSAPSPFPAPGVIMWTGYIVQPAGPSSATKKLATQAQVKIDATNDRPFTPEEKQAKTEKVVQANVAAQNPDGGEQAEEFSDWNSFMLDLNEDITPYVPLTTEEVSAAVEISSTDCAVGKRVAQFASLDVGKMEYRNTSGNELNFGGFPNGKNLKSPGTIDKMIATTGLNNKAKTKNYTSEGYYWCAAAVTYWWKKAGLPTPPGPAACKNWNKWASKNGYLSTSPVIGSAILYYVKSKNRAGHIGIVSVINADGSICTIEGNTGGKGFDRNGGGCFVKKVSAKTIASSRVIGFVVPPVCVV